jgi:hypothetical protein
MGKNIPNIPNISRRLPSEADLGYRARVAERLVGKIKPTHWLARKSKMELRVE